ncbi:hypothetical protein BX616_010963 [Lobosporangium transversale]|nr:hypothetical protein BX616_010963 [Lobosporangium transversale]
MRSIALTTVTILALVARASAQVLSYAHPISADRWTAGGTGEVTWSNACTEVTGNTTFPIMLNHQVGQFQVDYPGIPPLGYLDCSKPGTVTVQVPMVPQGSKYSILVTNGSTQSYSAQFTIESTIPPSNTTSTGTVSATLIPTTTSAAPITTTLTTTLTTTAARLPTITTGTTSAPSPIRTNQAGTVKTGSCVALVMVAVLASIML